MKWFGYKRKLHLGNDDHTKETHIAVQDDIDPPNKTLTFEEDNNLRHEVSQESSLAKQDNSSANERMSVKDNENDTVADEDNLIEQEITTLLEEYENSQIPRKKQPPIVEIKSTKQSYLNSNFQDLLDLDNRVMSVLRSLADGLSETASLLSFNNKESTVEKTEYELLKENYHDLAKELTVEIDSNIRIYQAYYRLALKYRRINAENQSLKKLSINEKQYQQLKDTLQEKEASLFEIQGKNRILEEIKEKLEKNNSSYLDQQNVRTNEMRIYCDSLEKEKDDLCSQIQLMKTKNERTISSYDTQLQELRNVNKQLVKDNSILKKENDTLSGRSDKQQQENQSLKSEISRLNSRDQLISKLLSENEKLAKEVRNVQTLEKSQKSSEEAIISLRKTITELTESRDEALQKATQLEISNNQLQLKLSQEQNASSAFIQKYTDKEKQLLAEIQKLKVANSLFHSRSGSDDLYVPKQEYKFGISLNDGSAESSTRSSSFLSSSNINHNNINNITRPFNMSTSNSINAINSFRNNNNSDSNKHKRSNSNYSYNTFDHEHFDDDMSTAPTSQGGMSSHLSSGSLAILKSASLKSFGKKLVSIGRVNKYQETHEQSDSNPNGCETDYTNNINKRRASIHSIPDMGIISEHNTDEDTNYDTTNNNGNSTIEHQEIVASQNVKTAAPQLKERPKMHISSSTNTIRPALPIPASQNLKLNLPKSASLMNGKFFYATLTDADRPSTPTVPFTNTEAKDNLSQIALKSFSDLSGASGGNGSYEVDPDGSPRWVSKPRIDVKTHFFQNHRRAKSLLSQTPNYRQAGNMFYPANSKAAAEGVAQPRGNTTSDLALGASINYDEEQNFNNEIHSAKENVNLENGGIYQRKSHSVNNIKRYT